MRIFSLRASSPPANMKAELLQSATRLVTAAASQSPILHFCVILVNPLHLSDPHILHLHHEEAQPCDVWGPPNSWVCEIGRIELEFWGDWNFRVRICRYSLGQILTEFLLYAEPWARWQGSTWKAWTGHTRMPNPVEKTDKRKTQGW